MVMQVIGVGGPSSGINPKTESLQKNPLFKDTTASIIITYVEIHMYT